MYSASSVNASICLGAAFFSLYSFFSFHRVLRVPENVASPSHLFSPAPRLVIFHVISRYIEPATPRSLNTYIHVAKAAKAITWQSLHRVARPTACFLMGQSPSANDSLVPAQAVWLTQDLTLIAGAS